MRSFSETAVCYASKDGTTKEGGSDGGKVKDKSHLHLFSMGVLSSNLHMGEIVVM